MLPRILQTSAATPNNTGPILTYTYDANSLYLTSMARIGLKNAETVATTQTASLVYDSLGRLKTGIDKNWYPTAMNYDAWDRVIETTDPVGNQRTIQYDANNNRTGERLDLTGVLVDSTSASFDFDDRRQSNTDAGGNVTAYGYDEAGNLTAFTNPDNYATHFNYDEANHLTRSTDPQNQSRLRQLDSLGRPRKLTDANGNTTTYSYYDSTTDGRLKSITDAVNHLAQFNYDPNGNTTTVTVIGSDGLTTRTTQTFFDELNRPARIVGPQYNDATLGIIRPVTKYTYDTLGNRTQVAAGYTTDTTGVNTALDVLKTQMTLTYDDFSRTIRETDPLSQFRTFVYDANNNLSTSTDALLQTTTYTWKYGQLLDSIKDQNNKVYSFSRNALGQYTDAYSPAVTYHYDYDTSHRLIALTDSRANKILTYAYSPGGLLNTLRDSDGNRTDYIYDPNGRMTGIWAPNDDLVSLNYDNGGRLIEKWLPNGEDSQYLYNPDNTLQSLSNKRGLSVISSHVYTYDPLGNRQTQAETINATTINYIYGYDPLNRLTQVQNGNAAQQENYSYDPIGNRLTKQVNATTPSITAYVYDVANQLKEIRQGSAAGTLLASLSYDANGNMKTRSDTGLSLTYDALNRMTQATLGTQTSSYLYDALGRRLQKNVAGVATNYLYTGQNLIAEYGATWGLPTSQYVHGPGIDDVVIRVTSTGAQYFHQDGMNSVVALTNNLGTTDTTQRFDAWGNKIASTGTTPHFGYTGREPDETGLMFYRARYYDPSLGRFTQRDQIGFGGGMNHYVYVHNNTVNAIDPSGHVYIFVGGAGDASSGIVKNYYTDNFHNFIPPSGQGSYYYSWDQGNQIQALIESLPAGEPINLIGHSYGGDTVATIAAQSDVPINILVTIDPVSLSPPDFLDVAINTNIWVDVNANTENSWSWNNIVAGVGGSWDRNPEGYATYYIDAQANHQDFESMMNATGPCAPRSAYDLLNDPLISNGMASPQDSASGGFVLYKN